MGPFATNFYSLIQNDFGENFQLKYLAGSLYMWTRLLHDLKFPFLSSLDPCFQTTCGTRRFCSSFQVVVYQKKNKYRFFCETLLPVVSKGGRWYQVPPFWFNHHEERSHFTLWRIRGGWRVARRRSRDVTTGSGVRSGISWGSSGSIVWSFCGLSCNQCNYIATAKP